MADVAILVHYVLTEVTDTEGTTADTVAYLLRSGKDPIATSGMPLHPSSFVYLLQAVCPSSHWVCWDKKVGLATVAGTGWCRELLATDLYTSGVSKMVVCKFSLGIKVSFGPTGTTEQHCLVLALLTPRRD